MRFWTPAAVAFLLLCSSPQLAYASDDPTPDDAAGDPEPEALQETETERLHWRCDPEVLRRPGSYIGGGIGYVQSRAWVEETENHAFLEFGPFHAMQLTFRVGDAFAEWIAVGFQIEMMFNLSYEEGEETVGAFALYLDTTFFPIAGLGLRPSLGMGMGYAMGEKEYNFGFGGPGSLGFAMLYEIRLGRLLVVSPIAQAYWIGGDGFDGLFLFFGLEVTKWFDTPTG
jgi:hypothetical protein